MELELHRIHLLQTGAAAPGTLVVLPPGENKTQKVAVGDLSGVVQCFSVKRGEVATAFRTLPGPAKVTALALGRAPKQRDKIFIAAGNTVRGVTKKGREFFRFVSGLTDAIGHLAVADAHVWAGCQAAHSHYTDGADRGVYLAPDVLTATELLPLPGVADWVPVLACRDCCIRILGPDGKPLFEVATPSPPTALRYVAEQHGPPAARHASARELLYGCEDGRVVQLLVDAGAVRQGFVIAGGRGSSGDGWPGAASSGGGGGGGGGGSRAAVTAIHCGADYSKTGCADIVLGREDGSVEVWDVDAGGAPRLAASVALPEAITAVDGGYITSAASPDIVVQTFTGKVVAFASHPAALVMAAASEQARSLKASLSAGTRGRAQHDVVAALDARIARETADVAELRAKVAKERERLAENQGAALAASQAVVDVRHRLSLQGGAFQLYVEAAVPLFALALKSSVPLKPLDLPGSMAILSTSPPDPGAGSATLATYRFQESTNRISIRFTAQEGRPGSVTAFIIPATPPKTCSAIDVPLLPLCMHQLLASPGLAAPGGGGGGGAAVEQLDGSAAAALLVAQLQQERPCSELALQGSFSAAHMHAWLSTVLPDLPAHLSTSSGGGSTASSAHMVFKHHTTGALLGCQTGTAAATFTCESLSTMAILHTSLLAAATAAKQQVSLRFRLHPGALQHCAGLLWPRLEVQRRLARRRKLAAALQELQAQEGGDVSFLPADYQAMLRGGSDAGEAPDQRPGSPPQTADEGLDAAVQALMQLFSDFCRLSMGSRGAVARLAPGLERLLRAEGGASGAGSSLQQVVEFMAQAQAA